MSDISRVVASLRQLVGPAAPHTAGRSEQESRMELRALLESYGVSVEDFMKLRESSQEWLARQGLDDIGRLALHSVLDPPRVEEMNLETPIPIYLDPVIKKRQSEPPRLKIAAAYNTAGHAVVDDFLAFQITRNTNQFLDPAPTPMSVLKKFLDAPALEIKEDTVQTDCQQEQIDEISSLDDMSFQLEAAQ